MQPSNKEEYLARFQANAMAEGFGMETAQVFPCPFCAAPRWAVGRLIAFEEDMSTPHRCGECDRSAKLLFVRSAGSVTFEFVQTGGPDQPDWLEPRMRRVGQ